MHTPGAVLYRRGDPREPAGFGIVDGAKVARMDRVRAE